MKKLLLPLLLLFSIPVFATPVNVNTAAAEIIATSLTGISLKKAEAIVADRIQNGDFKSIEDLSRVIGIGEKTIAVNRADILLSASQTIAVNTNIPIAITTVATNTSALTAEKPFNPVPWTTRIFWFAGILSLLGLLTLIIHKFHRPQKPKLK